MADILSIFGLLLIIGLAFPALLTMIWLTLPAAVDRACQRLAQTPRRCLGMGFVMLLVVGAPVAGLLAAPAAGAKATGWVLIFLSLTCATIGAAGLAARLGQQMQERSSGRMSALSSFLTGALALELAVAFPLIGWLTVLPLALLTALGATAFALLRWRPRGQPEASLTTPPISAKALGR